MPGDHRAGVTAAALRRITVRDFRNLAHVTLDVPPGGLVLSGDNGHGKSNFLESIGYLHLFRSVRGARDTELVRFGTPGFHISGLTDGSGSRAELVCAGFERESIRRRITLDGVECSRLSDALGALPAVMFAPTDVILAAGAPADRRQYLDVMLASSSPRYLNALREYRTALAQRNAGLRTHMGRSQAMAWETALAVQGAILHVERSAFVNWARPRLGAIGEALAERGALDIRYRACVPTTEGRDEPEVCHAIAAALAASRERDLERGMTHAGPHRDDLDLRMNGVPLRRYGSAGQQRSAAIALRLLECAWFRERTGTVPILLLDDPVAELDRDRAARVLDLMIAGPAGQIFLAVPREDDVPAALTGLSRCRVFDGTIIPVATGHA